MEQSTGRKDNEKLIYRTGFTLIEILVAMSLGTFILTCLINLLLSQLQAYKLQQARARLHDNARMTIYLLKRDIRMAGWDDVKNKRGNIIIRQKDIHIAYYIANTKRKNQMSQSISALYKADLSKPSKPREMVEGIEAMQIQYAIVNNDHTINYVTSEKITKWSDVVGVRIKFIGNSVEGIGNQLLRKEWTTAIALRKKL